MTVPLPLAMAAPALRLPCSIVLESIAFDDSWQSRAVGEVAEAGRRAGAPGRWDVADAVFTQIVADVIDRPVEVARSPETSALGAAAWPTCGRSHPSLDRQSVALDAPESALVIPDADRSAVYDDCYERWCMMADTFERIDGRGR